MSYLNPLRLHFAGRFQAAPSTVNNDPLHFNNAGFIPAFQQRQDAGNANGWWNPDGDAAFRLIDCAVTAAWMSYEEPAAAHDPILKCLIGDSDRSPPAKLVDLDPEQQLTSEIWGLHVRICLGDGTNLLRARYETAAFSDIWDRAASGGGDTGAGAMYQSVLTDIEWGDIAQSPFLLRLRDSAADALSIKFNVDGYNMDATSPKFTHGRIVGTVGPHSAGQPKHFVIGRHFLAAPGPGASFFAPVGRVNFCVATVDAQAGKILLDLGNALPTNTPGGAPSDLGTVAAAYLAPATTATGGPPPFMLDTFNYLAPNWYRTTAGIVALPADRPLTPNELQAIAQSPLALTTTGADGNTKIAIAEASNGTFVRADRFVFRLNPGDTAKVDLVASQWGQPYAGARIVCVLDPSQLQAQASSQLGAAPSIGIPIDAVDFPARLIADAKGDAELLIRVGDPRLPREFIDGQLYGVRPFVEEDLDFGAGYYFNPWNFVSLLVWSGFTADDPPTWEGSLEPIFRQYGNLYPVMKPIVDLTDYDSVCANRRILALAFGLPVDNPNSMPVTRDLSDAKRRAILRWLSEPGEDGKPRRGTPKEAATIGAAATPAAGFASADLPLRGGKAAAAARRLMFRNKSH
jgi:hypothetical protein